MALMHLAELRPSKIELLQEWAPTQGWSYLAAVATAALSGAGQAEQYVAIDGELVRREPTALVRGSGRPGTAVPSLPAPGAGSVRHEPGATVVDAGDIRLRILRVPSRDSNDDAALGVLTGTWTDQPEPQTLVIVQALAN